MGILRELTKVKRKRLISSFSRKGVKMVKHKSITREGFGKGCIITGTLCGRMDNSLEDGWNIAIDEPITCKHCLKALNTPWGKDLVNQDRKTREKIIKGEL